jgi:hypothetical protein
MARGDQGEKHNKTAAPHVFAIRRAGVRQLTFASDSGN